MKYKQLLKYKIIKVINFVLKPHENKMMNDF